MSHISSRSRVVTVVVTALASWGAPGSAVAHPDLATPGAPSVGDRLFPGLGPDSICRDFGDVPALALETVFNQPLETFEKLFLRSRSLIVLDWNLNREIHTAIKSYLDCNQSLEG